MIPLNTKLDQHCYGGRGEGVIIYLDSLIFIETKTFYTKFPFSNIMHLVVCKIEKKIEKGVLEIDFFKNKIALISILSTFLCSFYHLLCF